MHAHAALPVDPFVAISLRFLDELTADHPPKDFGVRLWEGTEWGNTRQPRFTLVLNQPGALRSMFLSPSQLSLGEAFIYGDLDVEGDLGGAFDLADLLLQRDYSTAEKLKLRALLARLPAAAGGRGPRRSAGLAGAVHSKERDRSAVSYHYDLSNEFYQLWLDRSLTYSCGYFKSPEDDLDTAQEQKLDYLCRKLRLRRGERLLDLGCGWGGLVMHAASKYGVHATGITLSLAQAELACERIRQAGLADNCQVEVRDYRDLDPTQRYDKIVSVGMFEHVGEEPLPEYFRRAWNALRPGGVFLNHGIAVSATFRRKGPSFIGKYVFPDGELVPIHVTLRAAESAGFEVRDVESLREHYVLTLQHWVRRLEARAEEARAMVGEIAYRIWRLYMAGSAHAFAQGRQNLYQVLLSKPQDGHSPLPLTREDWYAG